MAVIVTQQGSDLSIQQNLVGDGTSLVVSYGTPTATQCRIGLTPSSNLAELAAMTGGGIVVRSNSTGSMNLCTFYSSDSSISINFNSTQANFQLGSTLTGTYTFSNAITLPVNSLALSALSTTGSTSGYVLTSNGSGVAPTWQAAGGGGGGGLTSVGLGEVSGGTNFDFTNNPLTSNGTITLDIAVGGLPLSRIAQAGATTGQILAWSGSAWTPTSASASSIAVVAPGLSSTTVTGITFTGSGVTGSAAGGIATINIPGGGSGSGLTSVELGNEDGTETILTFTNNPLTSNGTIGIGFAENSLPLSKLKQTAATDGQVMAWDAGATSWNPANWSDIPAAGNVTIPIGSYIDYGTIAIKQVLNLQYLQTYTGSNGSGAIYDSQFYPIGGFGGTAGQILSLVAPAAFGSPGTPQVLGWIDKGASTISVTAPGLSATPVGSITFSGSGVTGTAAAGVATITIPGGGGGGAVSSVSASGGTSVINPTTGAVVLQMDLPLYANIENQNFFIGGNVGPIGDGNFFVNGVGAPSSATSATANNTSFGSYALHDIGAASNNTAFGFSALYGATTATNNTAVGSNALVNVTTGSHNTALGYSAGPNANVITSRCTYLGSSSETTTTGIFNSAAIGYNSVVNSSNATVLGDWTNPMEVVVGAATSLGMETQAGYYSLLSLRNAQNSGIYLDNSTGLSSAQYAQIPGTGLLTQLVGNNLIFMNTEGYVSRMATYANDSDAFPNVYAPPANSLLVGNSNTIGTTSPSSGRDFLVLTPPASSSGLPTGATGLLGYSPAEGTTWFSSAPALAASFLAFGTDIATPVAPVQHVSYIATPDPEALGNPTFFTLPSDFAVGSSFRVIGSNPYGWIISTAIPASVAQRIVFGNRIVSSTLSSVAAIQTDPNAVYPSPTGYVGDWAELVYTTEEEDGTQVWTVMSPCNLDMFQS